MKVITEIKMINPEFMTIDKSSFKYYVSVELDKIAEEYRERYGENKLFDKMINEAYFNIAKRFEPHFMEREDDKEE